MTAPRLSPSQLRAVASAAEELSHRFKARASDARVQGRYDARSNAERARVLGFAQGLERAAELAVEAVVDGSLAAAVSAFLAPEGSR